MFMDLSTVSKHLDPPLKANLLETHALVKIRRGYPDIYRIKVWDPPKEKEVKKKLFVVVFVVVVIQIA